MGSASWRGSKTGRAIPARPWWGCDGGASRVRSLVFGSKEAAYTGQAAFRALMLISDVPDKVLANPYRVYVGRGQTLVHYPLRHNSLLNLIGVARQPDWQAEGWAIPATVEEFSSLFENLLPQARELIRRAPPSLLFKWGIARPRAFANLDPRSRDDAGRRRSSVLAFPGPGRMHRY